MCEERGLPGNTEVCQSREERLGEGEWKDFIQPLRHDFSNQLQAMGGLLDLIEMRLDADERGRLGSYLERLRKVELNMRTLLQQLSAFRGR